jgi:hypothetical protein
LLFQRDKDTTGSAVKTVFGFGVAGVPDDLTHNIGNFHIAVAGDFTQNYHHAHSSGDLTGNVGEGVLFQHGIEDSVGYLVTKLVWMTFGDRLRSGQV